MARTSDRQTTELQIRAALLNRFTALGTPETSALHKADGDQGQLALRPISATEPEGHLNVQSRREVSRLTPLWETSYGPGSSRQRPHDSGGPSSATAE